MVEADPVHLPVKCTYDALLDALGEAGAFEHKSGDLLLIVPRGCFISCAALSFLCSWGLLMKEEGRRIELRGDDRALSYLSRMNLHRQIGLKHAESYERRDETGRFMPLQLIEDDEDVFSATNEVMELIVRQFDEARDLVPPLEWIVNETNGNILLHAESPVPGAICAQYFPKAHRLDIAICDMGRGIKASLGETLKPWAGHGDAVKKALQRGVTRDPEIGQGNGLAGAFEIMKANGGGFRLWTGDVLYRVANGEERGFQQLTPVPGTGVAFAFRTQHPVALSDTFLSAPTWSYIDAEAYRMEEEGGIQVQDDCISVGTRRPARRLRRKVLNILPEMDEPLILDFEGIERASSSFLDELLGRLMAELGPDAFDQQIRLVNMPEDMVDMANVVIEQRME